MPRWLKNLLILGAILLTGAVYAPYLSGVDGEDGSGGFLGKDLIVLAEAAGGLEISAVQVEPVPLQEMSFEAFTNAGGRGSVLSGASMALSRRLWGVTESSAKFYRLENLLLLIAAGLGMGELARRLLIPWTGTEHGRAAALALPVALVLHPLAVLAVVDLSGRAELLGLAFGSWAATTYLRGRQDRRPSQTLVAALLAVLASLSFGSGIGLALVLAVSEFVSAQRYRPNRNSWRAALTIFSVFAVLGFTDLGMRLWFGIPLGGSNLSSSLGGVLERLGVLVVSVPQVGSVQPGLGMALAATVFLLMMQPALRAARSAPRLWGWMLGLWFAGVLFATLGGAEVSSMDFSRAETLLMATAVVTSGLVVVATGVHGFRRLALPILLALAYSVLSMGQSSSYLDAGRVTSELRRDLLYASDYAKKQGAPGAQLLVLDPPKMVGAQAPCEGGIEHLLDPSITGRNVNPLRRAPLALTQDALFAFAREPEFEAMRRTGVALLLPPERFVGPPTEEQESRPRLPRLLPAPRPHEQQPPWTADPRSPDLAVDPFAISALIVQLPSDRLGTETAFPSDVVWTLKAGVARDSDKERRTPGSWIERKGVAEGVFDLSRDLDWLLSDLVGRMWFAEGLPRVDRCQLLPALPGGLVGPEGILDYEQSGVDWLFAAPIEAAETVTAPDAKDEWVLVLLDLVHLRMVELPASDSSSSGRLHFQGVLDEIRAWAPTDLSWTLERRVNSHTIWRHRGRAQ
jgi:hypothetical protein